MHDYQDRPWGWKDYWVYIVQCSDGSYYTGVTNSVERRLNQHNLGINPKCYTYKRRPVKHLYSGHFSDIWEAINWEKKVKKWTREKKKALAKGEWDKLPELAKRYGGFDELARLRSNVRRPIRKIRGMREIINDD